MKAKIRVVFLLTVLFLLVILSGCVAPESPSVTTPTQTETSISTATELSLKIGETAKLPEIEVTVISANKTDQILFRCQQANSTNTEEAKKGEIFVIADVEIKTIGDKGIRFGFGSLFKISDSAGFEHSQYYGSPVRYCDDDQLETGDLYPDHTIKGRILFEVPEEAKGLNILLDLYKLSTPDYKKLPTEVKSVSWRLE